MRLGQLTERSRSPFVLPQPSSLPLASPYPNPCPHFTPLVEPNKEQDDKAEMWFADSQPQHKEESTEVWV